MPTPPPINDGQWINGLDSVNYNLGQGFYSWGQNIVNRGGIIETRQGFAELAAIANQDPRGGCMVTFGTTTYLLVAIGSLVYYLNLHNPNDVLHVLPNVSFPTTRRQVQFEVCVQAQETLPNGVTRFLPTPRVVVIMQDGVSEPQYHNGGSTGRVRDLYPNPVNQWTKKGTYMKWVGDRLWIANGNQMYASNLLNPFQFTEQEVTASGGFFFLPEAATGMGVTHDYKSLLVFTNYTTSAFQVGLQDRTVWPNTQDFQRVILPNIGCAAHRTIINQYGMTWWMSHDGVVGLDNALSAYQSSRLNVRDQNMMRSKEGVSFAQGGGCAGTHGNFLIFSVPSGNKWNNHNWVMDEAVINTIQGMTPPAWCSNWTGIRPEQWITGTVAGRQRIFALSRDLTDTGHQATVWEAFIGQRMDVPKVNGVRVAKDIGCAVESRFIGFAPHQFAEFQWAELDVCEIVGKVRLMAYYCGRRTSYKKIIDTKLAALVNFGEENLFEEGIKIFVPQYRTVRSYTDTHEPTDLDSGIQTPYLRHIDREFSVLVQWNGQMALSALRMKLEPKPDYREGTDFPDETQRQAITAEGEGVISEEIMPPNVPSGRLFSQFLAPQRARWVEFPSYNSSVPNGVFFVSELVASPIAGAYPSGNYPITVNLISETENAAIYFTQGANPPNPQPPPNQVGELYNQATNRPEVTLGQTLKARGFLSGMSPSPLFVGQYTQAQALAPIFAPPAGSYSPDLFPVEVHITDPNPATSVLRYVVNTTATPCVTPSSPIYNPSFPPELAANQYLHAKVYKTEYLPSEETIGRYLSVPRCTTPVFTPVEGAYPSAEYNPTKTVRITTPQAGATLKYTINDANMTHAIAVPVNGNVEVRVDDVLRAVANKTGFTQSLTKMGTYTAITEQTEEPTITPQESTVHGVVHHQDVVVDCDTPNATVAYTVRAHEHAPDHPTRTNGTHISTFPATIRIEPLGHKILRLIAFRADQLDSEEVVGEYQHD